jgi:hypothetical protein
MKYFRVFLYLIIFILVAVFYQKTTVLLSVPHAYTYPDITATVYDRNALRLGPGAPSSRQISLEEPVELDFKSREEVFQIRAERVNVYADLLERPYLSSASIFGWIVGGRPWWGIEGQFCHGSGGMRSI